ncbi:MAG: fructosamine kinase family protein [Verrucomicrobiales bacterium]|nr:fructosamine kinase family protein [Verrucomicrobiales bacterium]
MIPDEIIQVLEKHVDSAILPETARSVGGGCIHEALLVDKEDGGLLFLKQDTAETLPLFAAEEKSLNLLRSTNTIRVPGPILSGSGREKAFLAMEGLKMSSRASGAAQRSLGKKLAALHSHSTDTRFFGASFNNYIGATPQSNHRHEDWADFFITERLTPQFRFAEKRGKRFDQEDAVLTAIHSHLRSLSISPSLLHGDLWGGNVGFLENDEPVIFDPASYYGDRETDLAFTRMFGGFSAAFYEAYREINPAPEPVRETIYNLYHLLNHFTLFGGSYASSAEASIREILKTI